MWQEVVFLESHLPTDQGEGDAKLLEAAWQLYSEHGLQMESSKLGSWPEAVVPAVKACRRLHLPLSPEADAPTTLAAFAEYAKG